MDDNTTGSATPIWDQAAAFYDRSRQADPVYLSSIRQATVVIKKGACICLDAGCGTGLSTVALSTRSDLVVAVDYSYESLKILKLKRMANVLPVQADLKALPFKNSVFDASVCANALQHLKPGVPQESTIGGLRRVTRPGGVLSVSVHHYSRDKRRAGWIKEGKPGQAGIDYIFRFSREDLRTIMPKAYIKAVGYYGLLRIPLLGSRLQDLLARLFGRLAGLYGFGHMLVAIEKVRKSDTTKNDLE